MLICKYTRRQNAAFVPHLDMLRAVTMAVRRIGARAAYSEGFNPHMKIFFGQPLPIGTESDCEYFCLYADEEPHDFMQRLNASLPQGVRVTAAKKAETDPNVARIMAYADYTVSLRRENPRLREAETLLAQPTCEISYVAKGKTVQKDVKPLLRALRVGEDNRTVYLRLSCGNENLRADRWMRFLCDRYEIDGGFDVCKTDMYDKNEVPLDKLLFGSDF